MGFDGTDFILLYVAEFIHRKNHRWFLRRIPRLRAAIARLKVVFAGKGALPGKCRREAERAGLSETVFFPGYRRDIDALCQMAEANARDVKRFSLDAAVDRMAGIYAGYMP